MSSKRFEHVLRVGYLKKMQQERIESKRDAEGLVIRTPSAFGQGSDDEEEEGGEEDGEEGEEGDDEVVTERLTLAQRVADAIDKSDRAARDIRSGGPDGDAEEGGGAQFSFEQVEVLHDSMVDDIQALLEEVVADASMDEAQRVVLRMRLRTCLIDQEAALASFSSAPQESIVRSLRRALDAINGGGGASREAEVEGEEDEDGDGEAEALDGDVGGSSGVDGDDLDGVGEVGNDHPESQLQESLQEAESQLLSESQQSEEEMVDNAYVVSRILARYARMENGEKVQFLLVDWQGYGRASRSWEPREALSQTDALRDFEAAHGPLGDDDGLVAVRLKRGEQWRIVVFTPDADSDREREAVWLTEDQLTEAGRTLVANRRRTGGRGGGSGSNRPRAAGRRRPGGGDDEEDEDDSDDDSDDDPNPNPGGNPGDGPGPLGGGALQRLLQYDNDSGAFRVSVTRTIREGAFDPRSTSLCNALLEYTITRLFLLACALPYGAMTDERMKTIASDYFEIERASFMRGFRETLGGPTEQAHVQSEVEFQVRRMRRRWTKLQTVCDREREQLRKYLIALKSIKAEAGGGAPTATGDADADAIVLAWREGRRWWRGMELPVARSTRQNSLLRKTAEVQRLVKWISEQRYGWTGRRADAVRRRDTLGSPYSGHRPTSWRDTTVVTVDHTIAQSWCGGTELVNVYSSVRNDLNNIIPVPNIENSKKSNFSIQWLPLDADEDRPDSGLFDPRELRTGGPDFWTEGRQAVSAKQVLYTFLSYGLITETSEKHVSLEDRGPGSGYYSRDRVRNHMMRVVGENEAKDHDKRVDDLLLFVTRTHNPLVHNHRLLEEDEFADDFKRLLKQRLEGETSFPALISQAIRRSVAGFPGD